MDLQHVTSFYHTAKWGSVTKAASHLEWGQHTIYRHLRKLEVEFGIILFSRNKRPMNLTRDGATFLKLVTPIVESAEALKTQVAHP